MFDHFCQYFRKYVLILITTTTHSQPAQQHLLTFGDHTLQANDVRVVKLSHDGRLSQEVPPLALHVTALERLYSHRYLLLSCRRSQVAAAHLTEFTFDPITKTQKHTKRVWTYISPRGLYTHTLQMHSRKHRRTIDRQAPTNAPTRTDRQTDRRTHPHTLKRKNWLKWPHDTTRWQCWSK